MFDFYQRRKLRSFIFSPFTKGVLLVLILLMAWSAFNRYKIASEMAERRVEAEMTVEELRQQKLELQEKVDYLSDDRGIEAEMRRQFDVALPNEQVVVIVDSQQEEQEVLPIVQPDEPRWYEFWR